MGQDKTLQDVPECFVETQVETQQCGPSWGPINPESTLVCQVCQLTFVHLGKPPIVGLVGQP